MAGSVNKIILVGRLGKDAEQNDAGTVAKFSLATNRREKAQDGTWAEVADWHNIRLCGNSVSAVSQYLTKGKLVAITGEQTHRQYEKEGVTKYFAEVLTFDVTLLGGRDDGTPSTQDAPAQYDASAPNNASPPAAAGSGFDDDLPFMPVDVQ